MSKKDKKRVESEVDQEESQKVKIKILAHGMPGYEHGSVHEVDEDVAKEMCKVSKTNWGDYMSHHQRAILVEDFEAAQEKLKNPDTAGVSIVQTPVDKDFEAKLAAISAKKNEEFDPGVEVEQDQDQQPKEEIKY